MREDGHEEPLEADSDEGRDAVVRHHLFFEDELGCGAACEIKSRSAVITPGRIRETYKTWVK